MTELESLRAMLRQGLADSMQGSYQRRLPEKKALPNLRAARKGLRDLVRREPSADAWRSLALAEESLLNYPAALKALEACMSLTERPDRKDLKRLVALREYASQWRSLGLTPEALEELGDYLDQRLAAAPCDETLRHTEAWLDRVGAKSKIKAIRAIEELGGGCDCEVLANVV